MSSQKQPFKGNSDLEDFHLLPAYFGLASSTEGMHFTVSKGQTRDGSVVDADSIFRIASLTKILTSIAIMQLVEQGRLGLDDRVDRYLKPISAAMVLDTNPDGTKLLRPPARPITVRHLLTHTAGFAYDFTDQNARASNDDSGLIDSAPRLMFDPGERWLYGSNTEWLGHLLEAVTNSTLDAYFRTNITQPLDMPDTDFNVREDRIGALVDVYHLSEPFRLAKDERSEITSNPPVGDGGLFSTGRDFIKVLSLFLGRRDSSGSGVLSAETLDYMCRDQLGSLPVRAIKSALPAYSHDFTFIDEAVDKWSLAFLITARRRQRYARAAGSLSWGGALNTHIWIDQTEGIAGLFFAQILPFANPVALAALNSFESDSYAAMTSPRAVQTDIQS